MRGPCRWRVGPGGPAFGSNFGRRRRWSCRATTVPGADTPSGATAGDLSIGYYDDDSAASITQNGTTTSFTLDTAGRRAAEVTGPTGGAATQTLERHYTDTRDNPAWVTQEVQGASSVVRYATSLGGDLAATITTPADGAPTVALPVVDLHGDAVTTIGIPATGAAAGIDAWVDHDEYGNPLGATAAAVAGTVTNGIGYGWLGGKQRATLGAGLILMGARLYNGVTGQFTSPDPVFGGGDTAYGYPTDPINGFDLDGLHWYSRAWRKTKSYASSSWSSARSYASSAWSSTKSSWSSAASWSTGNSTWARRARTACSWTPGWGGAACGGYYTAAYATVGNRREAARWGATTAASLVGGNLVSRGLTRGFGGRAAVKSSRTLKTARYSSSAVHGYAASGYVGSYWR